MRRLALISAVVGVVLGGAVASSSAAPQLEPPRVVASADAYVTAAARTRNFGGGRVLRAGKRPATRAYLRFDLKGYGGTTVKKATLRLHSLSARGRFSVHLASSEWTERKITFRNAPRPGRRVASLVRARRGLIRIDVTKAISIGKMTSFVITAPRGLVQLASREARQRAPRIDFVLESSETLIAAGDIGDCNSSGDEATAALVGDPRATVAALGDLAYENGSLDDFNNCYQPSWGAFKARTRPAPGNHEYATPGASGYFSYWGAVAGNPAQGWYSYDLGDWHVVSLNSNCSFVGCAAGSPQEAWLHADLAAHPNTCTLAYWHHPLFSGSPGTDEPEMRPLWQALYDANADVVLSGHAHNYQRFAPQNSIGVADNARGLRQFVVGTGGRNLFHPVGAIPNNQVSATGTWGVLELKLWPTRYDWQFRPVAGKTFTDSGSQACH